MMLTQEHLPDAVSGVAVAQGPKGLSAIHRSRCAAAIWQRQALPEFQSWIDGLDPAQLPRARVILRADAVRYTVQQICDASGMPDDAHRGRLVEDISALADLFAGLMATSWLRLRLDLVTTNACRRFHVDAVSARLVCTYRGRGTQYGTAAPGSEPDRIHTVPTGAPILLRGTLWPAQPSADLLHRSPPIEGTGETRTVLVLDPVTGPEDDF